VSNREFWTGMGLVVAGVAALMVALFAIWPQRSAARITRTLPTTIVIVARPSACCCPENACCEVGDGR
jgi:hypothetical protein